MEGRTHAAVSIATYVAICNKLPGKFIGLGLFMTIFGALFPDIDHPKSLFNKYILPIKNKKTKMVFYISLGMIIFYFDYLYTNEKALKALAISLIAIGISSHRNGLTHSLTGLVLFSYIVNYISINYSLKNIAMEFCVGYTTHLICDMMTKKGIPLFYPFISKKIKFPLNFKVGSKKGKFIETMIIIVCILYSAYIILDISSLKEFDIKNILILKRLRKEW